MSQRSSTRQCQSCGTTLAWDNTGDVCGSCQRSRRSELGPPRVPPEFWESPELQAAFAEAHVGKVFYAYRHAAHHGPRPVPQDVLAGWLGLTQTQISRYENGAAVTDLNKLIAWARTLRIPQQYLWFRLLDDQPPPVTDPDAPNYAPDDSTSPPRLGTLAAREPVHAEGGGDTRRRDFLAGAGPMLASILGPPLIHNWREPAPSNLPHLDDQLLAQLRAQTEGFRWLDRQDGAARLLPSTAQHARDLATFWRLTDDHQVLRDELGVIAADACHLVAYQAFDQGRRVQAMEWYRSSADLAAQAQCQDLYVFAMCGVAYMHARNGDGELALSVLHQLQPLSLSAAARCYLAAYEAHAHAAAQVSDAHRDAVLDALDRAASFAGKTRDEPPSPWLGIPGTSFVERQRALTMARFGDQEILELLDRLEERTSPVFQRYQVTLITNRALTYARRGDVDQAADRLVAAVERNFQVRSVEKHKRILEARSALEPHRDSREVRAVDELMRDQRARALIPGTQ